MSEKVTVHYPEYYSSFSCIDSRCEDTCCASWKIGADPAALRRYRREKGPFRERLRSGMDMHTGMFHMKEGRCPFLNAENLCNMYIHMGKESLCKTCREFPRHVEDYGYLQEASLSLACPEAAGLILSGEGQALRMKTKAVREVETIENEELLNFLLKMRDVCFYLLDYGTVPGQDEAPPMRLKLAMILSLAHDVQRHIRNGEEWPEDILGRYTKKGAFARFAKRLEDEKKTGKKAEKRAEKKAGKQAEAYDVRNTVLHYLECIERLEPVSAEWRTLTKECRAWLTMAETAETASSESFLSDDMLGCLMRYYLYSWLLGAVYDGEPYTQVKMAVLSCILAETVCHCLWTGEESRQELLVRVSHLWARELEHSDRNLELTERLLKTNQMFSFERLLSCILF